MKSKDDLYTPKTDKEALKLISAICFDYDGYHSEEKLKELIDEIKEIADKQLKRVI